MMDDSGEEKSIQHYMVAVVIVAIIAIVGLIAFVLVLIDSNNSGGAVYIPIVSAEDTLTRTTGSETLGFSVESEEAQFDEPSYVIKYYKCINKDGAVSAEGRCSTDPTSGTDRCGYIADQHYRCVFSSSPI